jgi:thioredoxin-related protein
VRNGILLIAAGWLLCSMAVPAQTRDSLARKFALMTKFDPAANAQQDIDDAVQLAAMSGKRVLLDVGGEWCKWCHRLDSLFQLNDDLSNYMHHNYVVVKVNYSRENENKDLLSKYPKIPGYPHLFILENNGSLLHSQDTGELENGAKAFPWHDKVKVFALLKKWAPSGK